MTRHRLAGKEALFDLGIGVLGNRVDDAEVGGVAFDCGSTDVVVYS